MSPAEQQPGPSRKRNILAKSLTDERSDEKDDGATCKIYIIPWIELMEKWRDGFNAIYAINISSQSAMTRYVIPQLTVFLWYFHRITIINHIQDAEVAKKPPNKFSLCNFYKSRNYPLKLSDFLFWIFCHTCLKFKETTKYRS